MDFREKADEVVVFGESTGFCYMITFFINGFRCSTFRTIPDKSERLKFHAIRFRNIAVIDMDYRLVRNSFADLKEIRAQGIGICPFV